jgi:putative transposase
MARKPRIEFEGAIYHVINRGNYRSDAFVSDRTKLAFEKCLFEACELKDWRLHGQQRVATVIDRGT